MPFDAVLVVARFGLYAALAATAGLPLFWWSMAVRATTGRRAMLAALAVASGALSLLWLLASAASMTGTPLFQPDWSIIDLLLTQTPLGSVMAIRLGTLLLTVLLLARSRRSWAATVALPASVAAATLPWSGHAAASEGVVGSVHRLADAVHVIAAAGWLGALLALLHATFQRAFVPGEAAHLAKMLHRFSLFGTIFVAALLATGAINALVIVGPTNLTQLTHTLYGILLLAKLALFGVMLILAATNRWRFTPAFAAASTAADSAAAQRRLRLSLLSETAAALAILLLVATLGTLDPLALP